MTILALLTRPLTWVCQRCGGHNNTNSTPSEGCAYCLPDGV
ncbi:hypothetical protein [Streptomyces tsukubensis]